MSDPARHRARDPQRILLTTDAVGGVWRYTLDLASGMASRDIETTLAVLGPAPSEWQRVEALGIPGCRVAITGLPLDWTAGSSAELAHASEVVAEIAERRRVASVHLHTPSLVGDVRWPAPVVAVAHSCVATWWRAVRSGPMPEEFAWRAAAMRQGMACADALIAPSRAFADALAATYPAPLDIAVVHNGRLPAESDAGLRRRRLVLTAGRLWDEGKNITVLDRAAVAIDAPVLAAGAVHGPNGTATWFPNLRWIGALPASELAAEMAVAQVFAAPSLYEPFGLAVLEAAQAGASLVLSDIPTFRELWDGVAAFAEPRDPAHWRSALQRTLDKPPIQPGQASWRARCYALAGMVDGTLDVHRAAVRARAVMAVH